MKTDISRKTLPITASLILTACVLIVSCTPKQTPKPVAYPRVYYPERNAFRHFELDDCPFTFMLPDYYEIEKETTFLDTLPVHPCWVNLKVPELNGTIYLSYKDVEDKEELMQLVDEANKLTYKHSQRADFIEPVEIYTDQGVYGYIYNVGGNAATQFQFFVTDTSRHFVRGALYFYARPNADSIAPVLSFVKQDIESMIGSFEWENPQ